jgi:hypothetical protein
MSTHNPNKKKPTTILLPDVGQSAKRISHNTLRRVFRHLSGPLPTSSVGPSEAQRHLAITGFILGVVSILTCFFPPSSFPTSICGILIGIYDYRKSRALQTIGSWTIALSLTGLVISLLLILYANHVIGSPR